MTLTIKICGLSTHSSVAAAVETGADMVGFIFFPKSPRNVSPAIAAALAEGARGRAAVTAVTVDASDAALSEIVDRLKPDLLQLHGRETPERLSELRAKFGVPVMKVIGVGKPDDLNAVATYSVADRILLETKPPPGATLPGGNGVPFDWRMLAGFAADVPLMLSGGLDLGNVAEAIGIARPSGIDVSSGVERAPGLKDDEKIRAFIRAARLASGKRQGE
jgi:phosphoribosylanthranilate isomerase